MSMRDSDSMEFVVLYRESDFQPANCLIVHWYEGGSAVVAYRKITAAFEVAGKKVVFCDHIATNNIFLPDNTTSYARLNDTLNQKG